MANKKDEFMGAMADWLLADEPIMCQNKECRSVHTHMLIDLQINGQDIQVKAVWGPGDGRYLISRYQEDDSSVGAT